MSSGRAQPSIVSHVANAPVPDGRPYPSNVEGITLGDGTEIPESELTWRFSTSGGPGGQHDKPDLVGRSDWPRDTLRVSDEVIGRDAVALGVRADGAFVGYRMVPGGDLTTGQFAILEINHLGGMTVNFCEPAGIFF